MRNAPAGLQQEQALGGIHAVDARAPLILDDGLVIFFRVTPEHGERHPAFAQRRSMALHAVAAQPVQQRHHVAEEKDRPRAPGWACSALGGSAPRMEPKLARKRPNTTDKMAFMRIETHSKMAGFEPGWLAGGANGGVAAWTA